MTRTVVGVLRGGPSNEYNLSLKTGAAVLNALPSDRYETRDIFVDKQGTWHLHGMPATPARALAQVDVVFNAMHGGPGEDGTVGRIVERAGVKYAGAQPRASWLSQHKVLAREALQAAGIRMPQAVSYTLNSGLNTAQMAQQALARFAGPFVVKPALSGSSYGVRLVPSLFELPDAIGDVLDEYGSAIVEEYIRGREASVGVIEGFRNENLYVLPPAHVLWPEGALHLDSHAHEEDLVRYQAPSSFSYEEKERLADVARAAHQALGMTGYSHANFKLTPNAVYLLEVDAIPALYDHASFPIMLESIGSNVPAFLDHVIELAKKR